MEVVSEFVRDVGLPTILGTLAAFAFLIFCFARKGNGSGGNSGSSSGGSSTSSTPPSSTPPAPPAE